MPEAASELHPLVQAFNGALDRMEQAFVQLETFNADVAHELRTPLANVMGQTEVALARERTPQALRDTALLLAGVGVLVIALGAGSAWLVAARPQMPTLWSPPAPPEQPAPMKPLRVLLAAVDECRGSESLLVMLPEGNEREAALDRLQRQQRQIDSLQQQVAHLQQQLAAAPGPGAFRSLRDELPPHF